MNLLGIKRNKDFLLGEHILLSHLRKLEVIPAASNMSFMFRFL